MTPAETRDIRERRLVMRSMRRGIREMDLILSDFAGRTLGDMSDADLALYERLLEESDHDIYAWIAGRDTMVPAVYGPMVERIAAGAAGIVRP